MRFIWGSASVAGGARPARGNLHLARSPLPSPFPYLRYVPPCHILSFYPYFSYFTHTKSYKVHSSQLLHALVACAVPLEGGCGWCRVVVLLPLFHPVIRDSNT